MITIHLMIRYSPRKSAVILQQDVSHKIFMVCAKCHDAVLEVTHSAHSETQTAKARSVLGTFVYTTSVRGISEICL